MKSQPISCHLIQNHCQKIGLFHYHVFMALLREMANTCLDNFIAVFQVYTWLINLMRFSLVQFLLVFLLTSLYLNNFYTGVHGHSFQHNKWVIFLVLSFFFFPPDSFSMPCLCCCMVVELVTTVRIIGNSVNSILCSSVLEQ